MEALSGNALFVHALLQGVRVALGAKKVVVSHVDDQGRDARSRVVAHEIFDFARPQQTVDIACAAASDSDDMQTVGSCL